MTIVKLKKVSNFGTNQKVKKLSGDIGGELLVKSMVNIRSIGVFFVTAVAIDWVIQKTYRWGTQTKQAVGTLERASVSWA